VKGVRGFRFGLCFLRVHRTGGGGGGWLGCPGSTFCNRTVSPLSKFSIEQKTRYWNICPYNKVPWELIRYRLCGLMVRVHGYRSRGPGSIPGATKFSEK
jgi:hypothetical protein